MKTTSLILIVVPTTLLPLMLLEVEENLIGLVIAWGWIVTSFICLSWGVIIRRRGRKLGRACIIAGVIHITLVVALPLLTPAKTREKPHAERGGNRSNKILSGSADQPLGGNQRQLVLTNQL